MSQSDAYVLIICDGCLHEEEVELCPLARSGSWSDQDVKDKLEDDGWLIKGDQHYCEDCREKHDAADAEGGDA